MAVRMPISVLFEQGRTIKLGFHIENLQEMNKHQPDTDIYNKETDVTCKLQI
jgi:hypothetical protein